MQPLEYSTSPSRSWAAPSSYDIFALAVTVLGAAGSVLFYMSGFHLAGCHVSAERWCEMAAVLLLVVATLVYPMLLAVVIGVWNCPRSNLFAWLSTACLSVTTIGVGFLFVVKMTAPWW